VGTGGGGEGDGGGRRRGVGKGLLDDIPSNPIPLDLRRRLPIRSLKPPPPAAAANGEEEEEAGSSPARNEMERRTESKSSWNPPTPADSSRRMVRPSAVSVARVRGPDRVGNCGDLVASPLFAMWLGDFENLGGRRGTEMPLPNRPLDGVCERRLAFD
jgi:hypothetical protein